jgi:GT2 family glycosyltransferase
MSQSLKPHEILLVDNDSSDGSIEIVQRFPTVKILELDRNTGFAYGNNLGMNAASGEAEWIALVNPDAFVEPRWLEELMLAAEEHPEFDVFGSKMLNAANSSLLDGIGDACHISGLVWRMGHGLPVSISEDLKCEIFSACAAAALYRRSALLKVGGFDEDFFCYVEDIDLGFRLRLAGYRCLYVPDSVVHHIGSASTGGQHSEFAIYHGHRNLVWSFLKNMPGVLFWLLVPMHVAMNLITILWFFIQGKSIVILRAKRDALMGIPLMWRKRHSIQKARIASIFDIWHLLDKAIMPVTIMRRLK